MESPLITLIVPVWGDDALLVDLINRLPFTAELAEWIVAAVEPSETLRELARSGKIRLVVCGKPSRGAQMNAGAAQAHGYLPVLPSRGFRAGARAPCRAGGRCQD